MNRQKLVPIVIGLSAALLGALVFLASREFQDSSGTEVHEGAMIPDQEAADDAGALNSMRTRSPSVQVAPVLEDEMAEDDSHGRVSAKSPDPHVVEDLDDAKELKVSRETWTDPVNQRVLGDRRWMAEPSAEELEHIESVLNSPMPRTTLGIEARATSVSEMKWQIERCGKEFPTGGRIVVVWEIVGDAKLATSRDVRLGPVVDVQDGRFLDCVTSFVPPTSPTEETFRMTVEYPAFLDLTLAE